MKILILDIDGLGKASLSKLGLKRLAKRIKQGAFENPSVQNIIGRGWPEIYTGRDAYKTGGFYQLPSYVNGKIFPSQNTGLGTIKKIIDQSSLSSVKRVIKELRHLAKAMGQLYQSMTTLTLNSFLSVI